MALEKVSTNDIRDIDRKGEASYPVTTKLLLVCEELNVVVGSNGVILLLGSNVDCSDRSGKTIKGK